MRATTRRLRAKYPGRCASCGWEFPPGTEIEGESGDWHHAGGCEAFLAMEDADEDGNDLYAEHMALVRALPDVLHVTTFSSGDHHFVNRAGRCEDAPCCGCCS